MAPIERWTCQTCDLTYRTEDAALACHPPWHCWVCDQCGDPWNTPTEAERCHPEDGPR